LARAGAGAAGGIASFARTGNADNLANSLSGAASGLLGKAGKNELAAGINYGSNILTGNAGAALARAAGTAAGNALRDGVRQPPLGTGDTRVKPGEDTYTVEAEGVRHAFKTEEEAGQFAAGHALTVHDAGGEAAFIKQQGEDEARALQVFLESAGYQALPESLKEQAAEMFKGKGGALAYQAERPGLLTPLQGTLEGNTYGQGDTKVGTLRAGGGRADTDAGRMFSGDLADLEKKREELIAKKETLVKEYSQGVQDEYNALIGADKDAAEFQELQTAYNKAVQEAKAAQARGETVEMPVKGERLRELGQMKWHFPVPVEERSLEITPYQRQEYTGGTKTAPLEVQVQAGEPAGNTVKPGLVTPAFVPDPIAPGPREAVFNPEYGWSLAGADFSGGSKPIGFQGEEAHTPEATSAAPVQEEEKHDWAEYISAQYGGPLVYSDEQLKVKYFTVPKGRRLREAFKELNRALTGPP
jgi:hypothetical protein